jgi:hypothetical protein
MSWLLPFIEWLEGFFAALGLPHLAAAACHLAVQLGMLGPCMP